jgi:hypothetical protein
MNEIPPVVVKIMVGNHLGVTNRWVDTHMHAVSIIPLGRGQLM